MAQHSRATRKTPDGLTEREAAFVREYLKDGNATQAARRAGYSPKGARATAARLLARPIIRTALDECRQEVLERIDVSLNDVLRSIKEIRDHAAGIVRAGGKEVGMRSYRDALKANELLGRHLGAFVDRIEQTTQIVIRRSYVPTEAGGA